MSQKVRIKSLLRSYYIFLRDFFRDLFDTKIGFYASSLSWNTIFAFIPLMVVMLWVFTTLPAFETVYKEVESLVFGYLMPTDSRAIMEYVNQYIANSYKLGIIGIVYVVFAVLMFFRNYDYIVNDIFNAPKRKFWSAVKIYIVLLMIIPLFFGSSFYLSHIVQSVLSRSDITSSISVFSFLPFIAVWGFFYFTFQLSANREVSPQSAAVSSFITSLVWYISKSLFIFYVVHNHTYSSIYGSISMVLFFFLWIYISWAIFLHGLKFCYLLDQDEEIDRI